MANPKTSLHASLRKQLPDTLLADFYAQTDKSDFETQLTAQAYVHFLTSQPEEIKKVLVAAHLHDDEVAPTMYNKALAAFHTAVGRDAQIDPVALRLAEKYIDSSPHSFATLGAMVHDGFKKHEVSAADSSALNEGASAAELGLQRPVRNVPPSVLRR